MRQRRKPLAPTGRKHTRESINAAIRERGIELVDEYTHAKDYLQYRCVKGCTFEATLNALLYQGRGCPKCKDYTPADRTRREIVDGRPRNKSYFVYPPAAVPRPKK